MSDARVELELPEELASSFDRTRELALLEIGMASRRVSVKASSSVIQVLVPVDKSRLSPQLVHSPSHCRFFLRPMRLTWVARLR